MKILYLLLLSSVILIAKPTTVKGAECISCHEGIPSQKKFNPAATKMLKDYKENECSNCHTSQNGKLEN